MRVFFFEYVLIELKDTLIIKKYYYNEKQNKHAKYAKNEL